MTTFNTGWVLSSGQEINWTTTSLSDSTTVALIHEDKTIDNYINVKEMKDGKAYYYYSSWQNNGSYLYLKSGSQYYKGLKSDGGDNFKKEDLKRKETSYSSSSSGRSNYKTEVERTERLQVKVQNEINSIIRELGKDSINVSNLSSVVNGISKLRSNKDSVISQKDSTIRDKDSTISQRDATIREKDREIASRKRWAQGFGHGEKLTSLSLDFTPGIVFIDGKKDEGKEQRFYDNIFGKRLYKVDLKNRKRYYLKLIYGGEGRSRSEHYLTIKIESEEYLGDPNITLDGDYFIVE